MITCAAIVIRHATSVDAVRLVDLASLDSGTPPDCPALIAEVDGVARAALDLHDGSVVVDPFVRTAELVEMLHARAGEYLRRGPLAAPHRIVSVSV